MYTSPLAFAVGSGRVQGMATPYRIPDLDPTGMTPGGLMDLDVHFNDNPLFDGSVGSSFKAAARALFE